jgi:hypothetical protein
MRFGQAFIRNFDHVILRRFCMVCFRGLAPPRNDFSQDAPLRPVHRSSPRSIWDKFDAGGTLYQP